MPITLAKLFSPTVSSSLSWLGETVNMTWAPSRWTGEMDELAETMDADLEAGRSDLAGLAQAVIDAQATLAAATPDDAPVAAVALAEAETAAMRRRTALLRLDRKAVRTGLAAILVSWDVLGEDGKPYPTDDAALVKLDPEFLAAVLVSLSQENAADPQTAPRSESDSSTERISAPSPTGTFSSGARTTSASRRGK